LNSELAQWQSAAFPDGKLHNSLIKLIVEAVWADAGSLSARELGARYGMVRDALDGLPVPTLSRRDRAAIEAAAKPILAGAGR
jgi:hypothetical protein